MSDSEEEFIPEGDVPFEALAEEGEEMGPALVKKLRERLATAVKEKQEYLDGWQRSRADFTNFKREEAMLNAHKEESVKAEMAEAIIPSLDSFEMAFKDATFMQADANVKKGIEALYNGLQKSLAKVGIERHWPVDEPFNPHHHEALREAPTEDAVLDHTVESVLAAGYSVGDRVIRPAQVSVWAHQKQ